VPLVHGRRNAAVHVRNHHACRARHAAGKPSGRTAAAAAVVVLGAVIGQLDVQCVYSGLRRTQPAAHAAVVAPLALPGASVPFEHHRLVFGHSCPRVGGSCV
jgi:hypothetical protein